jgi:hypothetical protein
MNIGKNILNYFNLIKPDEFDKVTIHTDLMEMMGVILLEVTPFPSRGYASEKDRNRLIEDMENMFPYVFKLYYNHYEPR